MTSLARPSTAGLRLYRRPSGDVRGVEKRPSSRRKVAFEISVLGGTCKSPRATRPVSEELSEDDDRRNDSNHNPDYTGPGAELRLVGEPRPRNPHARARSSLPDRDAAPSTPKRDARPRFREVQVHPFEKSNSSLKTQSHGPSSLKHPTDFNHSIARRDVDLGLLDSPKRLARRRRLTRRCARCRSSELQRAAAKREPPPGTGGRRAKRGRRSRRSRPSP